MQMTCADNMCVTPGVVLHKIGQLRQVFAWVPLWMLSRSVHVVHTGQQLCITLNGFLVKFYTTSKAYINTFKTNVVFNYKSHQLLNKPDVLIYILTIFKIYQKSK